jgi:hypothetical protein
MEEKKIVAPFKMADQRVMRPSMYLEKGGDTVYFAQRLTECIVDGSKITFITPNAISLFYGKSWKEYQLGLEIYNEIIKPYVANGQDVEISQKDTAKMYDYLEHIQTSVITIFSAIEALCNVAIPSEFTLTKKNSKDITETWDKSNIEKWTSTEEKIGKIVPEILKIKSPKTLAIWEDFKKLKQIRDDIIHQKQVGRLGASTEFCWLQTLISDSIFVKIMAGFHLIQYFCIMDKMHSYFPMIEAEIPFHVNIVDQFPGAIGFKNPK